MANSVDPDQTAPIGDLQIRLIISCMQIVCTKIRRLHSKTHYIEHTLSGIDRCCRRQSTATAKMLTTLHAFLASAYF